MDANKKEIKQMIPYYHNQGKNACGKIAWYWKRDPQSKPGECLPPASEAIGPKGEIINPGDRIMCFGCKRPLTIYKSEGCG